MKFSSFPAAREERAGFRATGPDSPDWKRALRGRMSAATGPLLAAGGGTDVFHTHSPFARAATGLLNTTFIVSAFILTLVTALIVLCILRFRARPGEGPPAQIGGHKWIEIAWTLGPFLLVCYLFVLSLRAMEGSDPADKSQPPDVVIVGHQFWWEVRYPRSGVVTANEIHIPTGRKLLFELKTADVIHDFWVPQLSRKMDLMPDQSGLIWLEAERAGLYGGACSEFCGAQHAWMRLLVVAQAPEEFEAWQQRQLQPAATPATTAAQRGARLAQQLTCVNCHALNAQTSSLQAGPDLRHLEERRTLGAGVLDNTPEGLTRWLKNPQAVKPGNLMPNMQLSDEQVADLVSYLHPQAAQAKGGDGSSPRFAIISPGPGDEPSPPLNGP